MSETLVISLLKDLIKTSLVIAAPMLIVATVVGLIISIFQATTQIQEQTLTFVPKIIAVALIGLLMSSFIINTMTTFTEYIFSIIANM
ncbi:flagellar biosynthetic protein FliQ [Clostridium argentinense CDC 2741]|uniref:Flagellar biosynthetic protein FliQ n=1 Tax=Clostridium argentinense CDC 2741 TaxID=1418104 RepID=A0A0C1U342_9CLOT|nr:MULTISPECIES: flagellar biosynthesis protein FliQ [Clostridium]ARC85292.1 flagellar biosynthetic protein FliQ [Clostridium argentinense]KIE47264.1 flagellar biosynthetic protein FliQ [Clostridium argentinense CDC 2741]NFF40913.1 flagellar biosynthesis protein FliQ [Clostridium argentinense]NFP51376.1 flagellar biosynthesis protein FliQ [Clostridium argentinense]NFP73414.1 flagellar biosynthesis protein FliQ [Clostridium argentinense]